MRRLLIIYIFIIFGNFCTKATEQVPDILIINKDTLEFRFAPIKYHMIKDTCLFKYSVGNSSNCWDKFYNVWIINNDSLFIKDIKTCQGDKSYFNEFKQCKNYSVDDSLIFNNKINGEYWCEFGQYVDIDIYGPSYHMNEVRLYFENGILKEKTDFLAKEYYESNDINNYVSELVYKNIDWKLVNEEMIVQLTVAFELYIDKNGNAECRKSEDLYLGQILREKIERIVSNINNWNKYSYTGEIICQRHFIEIYFDNNIMKKYAR